MGRPKTPPRPCIIEGCANVEKVVRGMCRKHYAYWYRRRPTEERCGAKGCEKPPYSSGWCAKHWDRIKRHGSPYVNLHEIKDRLVTHHGYVLVPAPAHPAANSGKVAEHRLVMERRIGRYLLPGENVHHINGVRDDNRPENLELWVKWQPAGQRVEDLVAWAREVIDRYEWVNPIC